MFIIYVFLLNKMLYIWNDNNNENKSTIWLPPEAIMWELDNIITHYNLSYKLNCFKYPLNS